MGTGWRVGGGWFRWGGGFGVGYFMRVRLRGGVG